MTDKQFTQMKEARDRKIKDRLERIFRQAQADPTHAQESGELPKDKVLGMKLANVQDIVGDLTLLELYHLVKLAMNWDAGPER
jgi:hypothetical protein